MRAMEQGLACWLNSSLRLLQCFIGMLGLHNGTNPAACGLQ